MSNLSNKYHSLFLKDLSLGVHLGCTAEERANTQEVRVSIEFRFNEMPTGVLTDDLRDTICYAKISEVMALHCKDRHFNLVEKLAYELFEIVQKIIEGKAQISLQAQKVAPPVEGLKGGVVYSIGDFR